MKRAALLCVFASLRLCVNAAGLDRNRLADAIYLAEGGPRAKVPYGILTVKVHNAAEARQVCLRTIDHAWRDYSQLSTQTHSQLPFLDFLANRYCPPPDAPGNRHWKHNVRFFYFRHPQLSTP